MRGPGRLRTAAVLVAHAIAGWAYCGALIGVGRRLLPMPATLAIHAIGAPSGFALVSWLQTPDRGSM